MIIHILAGGPEDHHPDFTLYEDEEAIWAGVDRGVYHLLKKGIDVKAAFGDFDSVTEAELSWMREQTPGLHMMNREKDYTDLEIALDWALEQQPSLIRVFGATGGRMDHALANIQMLVKGLHAHTNVAVIDHKNEIYMQAPGMYTVRNSPYFPYISFLPMSASVTGITLQGFKYPLTNETIQWGMTLCVSNELTEEKGTFSFVSGILMVVRSKD